MSAQRIGPYEIIDRIGAGGMGTVYRARHAESGQAVALKVMRAEIAEDPQFLKRFQREARIAMALDSPNIVRVTDAGVADGTPYIAMEMVEGESLAALLRGSGVLDLDQALQIALHCALGLQVAHEQGVVHRDISPQNILIARDGTAKIADFGIARAEALATMTITAMFLGKPAYAAPEVFEGRSDVRSDIYALGVVLFQMLSGRAPFVAHTPLALMDMHVRGKPPSLVDLGVGVPPAVEALLARCLCKDPADRYQTPRELARDLGEIWRSEEGDDTVIAYGGAMSTPPQETLATPVRRPRDPTSPASLARGSAIRGWRLFAIGTIGATAVAVLAGFGVALVLIAPSGGVEERSVSEPVAIGVPTTTGSTSSPSHPNELAAALFMDAVGEEEGSRFVPDTLSIAAGELVEIVVSNKAARVSHNLRVSGEDGEYETDDPRHSKDDWLLPIVEAGRTGRLQLKIDTPGTYKFQCDFHPQTEKGTLIVGSATTGGTSSVPEVGGNEITTANGLKYIDIEEGTGAAPVAGQRVSVHYTGWLEYDGSKFDSSLDRGQPFEFVIGEGNVIGGWDEGLSTMKVGGKRRLIIPPELGYGEQGSGQSIPPNSTLIFDVELLDVR